MFVEIPQKDKDIRKATAYFINIKIDFRLKGSFAHVQGLKVIDFFQYPVQKKP